MNYQPERMNPLSSIVNLSSLETCSRGRGLRRYGLAASLLDLLAVTGVLSEIAEPRRLMPTRAGEVGTLRKAVGVSKWP